MHEDCPWTSVHAAEADLAAATRNLIDGDLIAVCGKIFSIYEYDAAVDVGYCPNSDSEYKELQRLQDHCQRLLDPCLGYVADEEDALTILHKRLAASPSDKTLNLSLGLILSRSDEAERRRQAHQILEKLARANQIPRAEGYGALARLRQEAGDVQGAQAALSTCRKRTRRQGICPQPDELSTREPPIPPPPPAPLRIPIF